MGYHIITDTSSNTPTSQYFTSLDELFWQSNIIHEDSIVYQGEASWTPVRLRDHEILKDYTDAEKRVGRRAELVFESLAIKHGYIVQRIDQDVKSYMQYKSIMGGNPKRSDYLIMNLANIEIDVKCLSLYTINQKKFFMMNKKDIDRHLEMLQTGHRRLIFAIFLRARDWCKKETLGMIDLEKIVQCDLINKDNKQIYLIPSERLTPHFQLLDEERELITIAIKTIRPTTRKFTESKAKPIPIPQEVSIKAEKKSRLWLPLLIAFGIYIVGFRGFHLDKPPEFAENKIEKIKQDKLSKKVKKTVTV